MPPKNSPEAIWARARAKGYTTGAFETEDSLKDVNKHVDNVKCNHKNTVFYRPGEEPLGGLCLVCGEDGKGKGLLCKL